MSNTTEYINDKEVKIHSGAWWLVGVYSEKRGPSSGVDDIVQTTRWSRSHWAGFEGENKAEAKYDGW